MVLLPPRHPDPRHPSFLGQGLLLCSGSLGPTTRAEHLIQPRHLCLHGAKSLSCSLSSPSPHIPPQKLSKFKAPPHPPQTEALEEPRLTVLAEVQFGKVPPLKGLLEDGAVLPLVEGVKVHGFVLHPPAARGEQNRHVRWCSVAMAYPEVARGLILANAHPLRGSGTMGQCKVVWAGAGDMDPLLRDPSALTWQS